MSAAVPAPTNGPDRGPGSRRREHLETSDPKQTAGGYPGAVRSIATRAEGMRSARLLPRHADVADKFSLLAFAEHTGLRLSREAADVPGHPG